MTSHLYFILLFEKKCASYFFIPVAEYSVRR